jgi:N-acetylglutamate synthase-like GNAT family acetyltransferase
MKIIKIKIEKRKLKVDEIDSLIDEVIKVPQLIAGNRKRWQKFDLFYVASENHSLIGVCAVVKLNYWIKLGPLVVLEKYRNKGFGKRIINEIIRDYTSRNIFIGSPTPAVWRISQNLGFQQVKFFYLPSEVKKYLINQTIESIFNLSIIKEFIQKSFLKKEKYCCFIKTKSSLY